MGACSFTVSDTLGNGELKAEVAATSGTLAAPADAVRSDGPGADPVGQRSDRPVAAAGDVLADRLGGRRARGLTGSPRRSPRPVCPLPRLASGAGTASVAVGDLNGDGIPDIVTANRIDDTVSVFLGTGDGTFLPPKTYAVGARVWRVTLADVTNDGKLDILTANKGANTVSILLGNGDGTFQPQIVIPVGTRPIGGDGGRPHRRRHPRPDRRSNYAADTIWVLLGNGNGTFQAPHNLPHRPGPGIRWPVAGDGGRPHRRRHPRPDLSQTT